MSKSVYYSLLNKGTGTKEEVWRLIFGLHCNLDEAIRILRVTGYGISADKSFYNNLENGAYGVRSGWDLSGVYDEFDRACIRCIEHRDYNIYNISKINSMLADRGVKKRMHAKKGVVSELDEDAVFDFLRKSVYTPTQMAEIIDYFKENGLIPLNTLKKMLTKEAFEAYSDRNGRG